MSTRLDSQRASGPGFQLDVELRRASQEALSPVVAALAALVFLIGVIELVRHPEAIGFALVIQYVVLVIGLVVLAQLARKRPRWTEQHVYSLAMAIGIAITGTAGHLQLRSADPLDTFYVGEAMLGVAGLVLSTRWALASMAGCMILWASLAWSVLTPATFVNSAYILVSAACVGALLHAARLRTHSRLAALRFNEAVRKQELEAALGAAEAARVDLDRRVDERTRALAQAYEDLQRELDERKRVEADRRGLADRLHQTQRMESIGRLAGGVAHDFNNLLSVIMGNAELIVSEDDLAPVVRESAHEIVDAAERAAGVTRQLLAFGRKQVMAPRVVQLREVVDDVVRIMRRAIGEDVALEVDIADDVPPVMADPGQLEQAVMNLVVNARDAMPTGGRLRVAVSNVDVGPELTARFPGAHGGPHARITISDTGGGMDATTLASIWEPFFTTKPVGKGTGLGLPMVQGIVTQHAGFIDVESTSGVGSSFAVYLPASDGQPRAPRVKQRRPETPTGDETVLVVEDEAQLRRLAVGGLRQLGYEVLEAGDGEQALEVARAHAGTIDFLLTDVVMPGMDGARLAERLRVERPGIAVLFVSGYDDSRIGKAGILPEHVDFLAKPYDLRTLGRRIREVLDRGASGTSGTWRRVSA